jgi:hypothetical protein
MENVKDTLLEQANKKLAEILENARNLVDFNEDDFRILADRKEILLSWTDELTEDFYQTLLNYPKTAKIFETVPVEKVKERFKDWYRTFISEGGSEEFYRKQFFIGLVHIYKQIDKSMIIFMGDHLKRYFMNKVFSTFKTDEAIYIYQAFSKLLDFIIALTIEGYVFILYQALLDIAGLKHSLVERMMQIKLEQFYQIFQNHFI